ncbi:hypothetical protein SASPL_157636 [Salvia splendens]|uniref:Response regulatory domain-containing protein n=1 Tax=Salvia splendens TaxID=180675 RepID=A0A8X8VUK5_SALSN|nr:hypothetical protein SASPL_157636 [Salvia splendens]
MHSVISAEPKRSVIEEAMVKGACFFFKKPISSKNLKNVWQHVYRKTRKMGIKSSDCQSHGAKAGKRGKVVHVIDEEAWNEPVNEHYGEGGQAGNDRDGLVGGMRLGKSRRKRPASSENEEAIESKRRKLAENHELADSPTNVRPATIWLG